MSKKYYPPKKPDPRIRRQKWILNSVAILSVVSSISIFIVYGITDRMIPWLIALAAIAWLALGCVLIYGLTGKWEHLILGDFAGLLSGKAKEEAMEAQTTKLIALTVLVFFLCILFVCLFFRSLS